MFPSIWDVAFLAAFGLFIEVVFTAITVGVPLLLRRHLVGYSSLWYIPLYGSTPFLLHALHAHAPSFFDWHWFFRGVFYMLFIYLMEGTGMFGLRRLLGSSPSEKSYFASGRSFKGLIRLDYAVFWIVGGLVLEKAHAQLHAMPAWP